MQADSGPREEIEHDMTAQDVEDTFAEALRLLRARAYVALAFAVFVAAVVFSSFMLIPDRYTATATFVAPKQVDTLTWIASGDAMFRKMVQQLDLREHYGVSDGQRLSQRWADYVSVRKSREGMLMIRVTDQDRSFAAKLANAIAAEAQQSLIQRKLTDSSRVLADYSIVLEQARSQLTRWAQVIAEPRTVALIASLPNLERYALEGVAKNQAEIAATFQRSSEDNKQLGLASMAGQESIWLQSQLLALGRGSTLLQKENQSPGMIPAIDALQRHVYWQTLVDVMTRNVVRLRELALIDVPYEPATEPDVRSGPNRVYAATLAFFGALSLVALVALTIAAWKRDKLARPASN